MGYTSLPMRFAKNSALVRHFSRVKARTTLYRGTQLSYTPRSGVYSVYCLPFLRNIIRLGKRCSCHGAPARRSRRWTTRRHERALTIGSENLLQNTRQNHAGALFPYTYCSNAFRKAISQGFFGEQLWPCAEQRSEGDPVTLWCAVVLSDPSKTYSSTTLPDTAEQPSPPFAGSSCKTESSGTARLQALCQAKYVHASRNAPTRARIPGGGTCGILPSNVSVVHFAGTRSHRSVYVSGSRLLRGWDVLPHSKSRSV